jgi:sulfite exporter TauE/SafE/copper chaperone CopZ/plastocyanin domain-containing protein
MKTQTIGIGGMTCINCQNRIEKMLKSTRGVKDAAVNFNTGMAAVTYNPSVITLHEITDLIEKLDYRVLAGKKPTSALEIIGILVIILSLYMLLRGLGIGLGSAFPLAEAGMGYGMLFIIGLVTSVHCVAMCGGINLSQCIPSPRAAPAGEQDTPGPGKHGELFFPPILYNAGRVISYTVVGVMVGALGSVISVSGRFQGLVQLMAGVFMVIMGLNMLGIFQGSLGTTLRRFTPRLPRIFARKIENQKAGNKNPLFIGLLNGLMPCGPLQAMQLYALSTGNPIAGGISMFLFSLGTVPLMFGIGAVSSALSLSSRGPAFTRQVMRVGAVLITVMGMTMLSYGFGLSGVNVDFIDRIAVGINPFTAKTGETQGAAFAPVLVDGVQAVNSTLSSGRYPAITVEQGIPVKWTINAPPGSINGCNNRMIIREYGIEHRFTPGENVIEFTPGRTGRFFYSCWMGMIRSSITVVEEGQSLGDIEPPDTAPAPAGIAISTEEAVLAEMREGYQTVTIKLRDDGIEPAIIVVQRSVPAAWIINNDSLDPGNSRLIFPAYYTQIDMEQGDNVIQLMPTEDFEFSTIDHVFYGYVKVVDQLNDVDIEAIKGEVSEFETLIYPDVYFETAAQGGACCGG